MTLKQIVLQKVLKKKTSKAIWTKSLCKAKLRDYFSDLTFIRDTADIIIFRIGDHRGEKRVQFIIKRGI